MQLRMTTLERAFELAGSGDFDNIYSLKQRLSHEGYVVDQLTGPVLLAQIKSLMRSAHGESAPAERESDEPCDPAAEKSPLAL